MCFPMPGNRIEMERSATTSARDNAPGKTRYQESLRLSDAWKIDRDLGPVQRFKALPDSPISKTLLAMTVIYPSCNCDGTWPEP